MAEFILGQVKFDNASKEGIQVEMLSSWRGVCIIGTDLQAFVLIEAMEVEEGRV